MPRKPKKNTKNMPLFKLRKGVFEKYGYKSSMNRSERRHVLRRAVKGLGGLDVYRRLNALYVLQKRSVWGGKWKRDRDWVKKEFYGSRCWPLA